MGSLTYTPVRPGFKWLLANIIILPSEWCVSNLDRPMLPIQWWRKHIGLKDEKEVLHVSRCWLQRNAVVSIRGGYCPCFPKLPSEKQCLCIWGALSVCTTTVLIKQFGWYLCAGHRKKQPEFRTTFGFAAKSWFSPMKTLSSSFFLCSSQSCWAIPRRAHYNLALFPTPFKLWVCISNTTNII